MNRHITYDRYVVLLCSTLLSAVSHAQDQAADLILISYEPSLTFSLVARQKSAVVPSMPIAKNRLQGSGSIHLLASDEDERAGRLRVRDLNLVLSLRDQALLTGRDAKTKSGELGVSTSDASGRIQFDNQSRRKARGKIPVVIHYPQLDALCPPANDELRDFRVSPRQSGSFLISLQFDRPLPMRNTLVGETRINAKVTGQLVTYPLERDNCKVGGHTIEMGTTTVALRVANSERTRVIRKLCVQPVRFRRDRDDDKPTGEGFDSGRAGAASEWEKASVVFEWQPWKTIYSTTLKSPSTDDDVDGVFQSFDKRECVEVFFVDGNFAETRSSGEASAKVLIGDGIVTLPAGATKLAHELGHVLRMGHPGNTDGLVDASTGTLMCTAAWGTDHPHKNSDANAAGVANPLLRPGSTTAPRVPRDCADNRTCGPCP